jgi:hypothetical protein
MGKKTVLKWWRTSDSSEYEAGDRAVIEGSSVSSSPRLCPHDEGDTKKKG